MRLWCCALLLAAAGAAAAQDPAPQGKPETSERLRDAEFGVSTHLFGLQRRVQMYQWQRSSGGYQAAWSDAPVDSSGFDASHVNPGVFAVQTRYWIASRVTLDGKPLDDDVLKEFGSWRVFRPGFSALPGNLAATFQPEGDGLSSADNPLAPQIGDLRIIWRELALPALADKVAFENGWWVPRAVDAAAVTPVNTTDRPVSGVRALQAYALPLACVLAVLMLFVLLRRRRARR